MSWIKTLFVKLVTPVGKPGEARKPLLRTMAQMLLLSRVFKISSLERIEEATVKEEEAHAEAANAMAQERLANAAEKQARVALTRAEARIAEAKADALERESKAKAQATSRESAAKAMKMRTDAIAKVLEVVAKLRLKGGDVSIIRPEVEALLRAGAAELPNDEIIREALERDGEQQPTSDETDQEPDGVAS